MEAALNDLDRKFRSGWQRRGIPDEIGETVLSHSKKVYQAALLYPTEARGLNKARMALMAFFHDIAEHVVPDFTPHDKITPADKHEMERQAIMRLVEGDEGAALILELWEEYEAQVTEEAKLVYQFDKLDAAIQAFEYGKLGYDVSEFFSYTEKKLSDPHLIKIFADLQKRENPDQNYYDQYFKALGRF